MTLKKESRAYSSIADRNDKSLLVLTTGSRDIVGWWWGVGGGG